MKKGARFALLAAVALALPVVVTLGTYAIAAHSLAPTSWLAISVDSRRLEPTPGPHSSPDADHSRHSRHIGSSGSSSSSPGHSVSPETAPSGHPPADDTGGDGRGGPDSPGDGGSANGAGGPDD